MTSKTDLNKAVVIRFNKEFIEQSNLDAFKELVADDCYNHSAPPGGSNGPDGMIHFLQHVLKAGFPDLKVEILLQVAEDDLVTTRKRFQATHTGEILGIPASGKHVVIDVIDIIRLRDGKYVEHWGSSNFSEVMRQLSN